MKLHIALAAGVALAVAAPTAAEAVPALAVTSPTAAAGTAAAEPTPDPVPAGSDSKSAHAAGTVVKDFAGTFTAAKKKSKKRVSIGWKTVKHTVKRSKGHRKYPKYYYRYTEKLRVPYLNGASKRAKRTFNREVKRKIAQDRAWAKPPSLKKYKKYCRRFGPSCGGVGTHRPYFRSYKSASGVYAGRYASAAIKMKPVSYFADDPYAPRAVGITVDLKTGKLVKSSKKFVKISKSRLRDEIEWVFVNSGSTLARKWCSWGSHVGSCDFTSEYNQRAWSVSGKGVTFTWYTGDAWTGYGPEYNGKVTVPWKALHR